MGGGIPDAEAVAADLVAAAEVEDLHPFRSLCLYRSASLFQPFLSVSVARFVSLSMFLCLNLSFSFVSSFSSLGGGAVGGRAA